MTYNGLVLLDKLSASPLARYNYELCHECGVVGARSRPAGEEYDFLVRNFDENLGRVGRPTDAEVPLPAERDEREALLRGLRSKTTDAEARRTGTSDPDALLWKDRGVMWSYLDFITTHVALPHRPRVLEVRSGTGWILDALRQRFAADVYAMPAFEPHRRVISELYGIEAMVSVDFENLVIPYEGRFDLILAKHMFTHALFPDRLLAHLRERLVDDGVLCLYMENDDFIMWQRRKNLVGEMKCFHMQNFDAAALTRALAYHDLRVDTLCHVSKSSMAVLARPEPHLQPQRMTDEERERRLEHYRRWHDESILSLPRDWQRPWRGEMRHIRRRALTCGDAKRVGGRFRPKVVPRRKINLMHAEGYRALKQAND